jgi:hypothetical protein
VHYQDSHNAQSRKQLKIERFSQSVGRVIVGIDLWLIATGSWLMDF